MVTATATDVTPPSVTVTTTNPNGSAQPVFSGQIIDDDTVSATISFCDAADCGSGCTAAAALTLSGAGEFSTAPPSAWTDGTHCARVSAADAVPHEVTVDTPVMVDTQPPALTVDALPAASHATQLLLTGTATDVATGVARAQITITAGPSCTGTALFGTPANATLTGASFSYQTAPIRSTFWSRSRHVTTSATTARRKPQSSTSIAPRRSRSSSMRPGVLGRDGCEHHVRRQRNRDVRLHPRRRRAATLHLAVAPLWPRRRTARRHRQRHRCRG